MSRNEKTYGIIVRSLKIPFLQEEKLWKKILYFYVIYQQDWGQWKATSIGSCPNLHFFHIFISLHVFCVFLRSLLKCA